ncbi:MAG: tRNA lysidine(34) synthetase TilS, partial [Epsilonproteobacteria bacterium]|nr:tRNA lysidine(34) synthetase TilS [Campylobacterota bacterium]
MIEKNVANFLKTSKNLLAFSGGVDSTALFFILKNLEIEFDIAIVDYALREEAYKEIEYAKSLAKEHNKKIFIKRAPKFSSNFEANAREFRYSFFKEIIKEHNYNSLITAHQLNDKIEWFLMRFSKGAGVSELSGMSKIEREDEFFLVRPLLDISKDELLEFLEKNRIKYFIDKSNFDK